MFDKIKFNRNLKKIYVNLELSYRELKLLEAKLDLKKSHFTDYYIHSSTLNNEIQELTSMEALISETIDFAYKEYNDSDAKTKLDNIRKKMKSCASMVDVCNKKVLDLKMRANIQDAKNKETQRADLHAEIKQAVTTDERVVDQAVSKNGNIKRNQNQDQKNIEDCIYMLNNFSLMCESQYADIL